MATYSRLGSYLLSSELTNDPIGRIHRGIVLVGDKFDRHILVRTFFDELLQNGIAGRMAEATKAIPQLGGSKAFGLGYRMEGGTAPHVVCDYIPGRSLAQLLVKAKHEQIPFGVDHALSVMQGIAQALLQLHAKGLSHGILSPHSVWVSFEGATHLLDAPFAAQIRAMLPKTPVTQTSLESYILESGSTLQQDFFSLGSILFEMLTLDRLPAHGNHEALVRGATLKAAQEEIPIPAEIQGLLLKLLGVGQVFATSQDFNAEMDRVLYDGDYSPTTFNMAFFMHTLFREENDTDTQSMKTEVTDDFSAYQMVAAEAAAGGRRSGPLVAGETEEQKSKKMLYVGAGVGIPALILFAWLAFKPAGETEEVKAMRTQLAELQRKQAEYENQRVDLENKSKEGQAKIDEKQRALSEAKTVAEREKAAQELEEQKKKQAELEKQKQDLAAKAKQAEVHKDQIAQGVEPPNLSNIRPAAVPPQPEASKPVESPKIEAPKPVAPTPAPAPLPTSPTPAPTPAVAKEAVEIPPKIVTQAQPSYPARARQMKQMIRNLDPVVTLKVFVDATGRPQKVQIIRGVEGAFGFNEASEKAALESQFQAGTKDGRPASGWVTITYKYPRAR